jgi:hypothetical protein
MSRFGKFSLLVSLVMGLAIALPVLAQGGPSYITYNS